MMKRVWLWESTPFDGKRPTFLGAFTLTHEGTVVAQFYAPGFESEVRAGLLTPVSSLQSSVFIEDGRDFFDALDTAFANSTTTFVTSERDRSDVRTDEDRP